MVDDGLPLRLRQSRQGDHRGLNRQRAEEPQTADEPQDVFLCQTDRTLRDWRP